MDSVSPQVLQSFIDGVCASLATLERGKCGQHNVIAYNDYFSDMFGGGSPLTYSPPFLLSDLIPRYNRVEFLKKVEQCFEEQTPLEFEQAYDTRDGTTWWRISLKPIINEQEGINRLLITGHDITTKIELAHKLELTRSRFVSVIEAAYDCIITINQKERIVLFNSAAQDLFGYSEEEIIGQSIEMLVPAQFRKNHSDHVDRFASSPIKSRQMEERNRVYGLHKNGSEFPVEIAISKINVGGMVEFTAIVRDISDKVRLLDHLSCIAAKDHLTGLANRREFEEQGKLMFTSAKRANKTLSLLMLDVDKFKNINDTYGHEKGDEVLQLLSHVGASTVQHLDLFARIGGEEFVVLMPETDQDQAMAMAERVRNIFDTQSFNHNWKEKPIPFTVSIGVSIMREDDSSILSLLKRADDALYRAKGSGRNKVEFETSD